MLNYKNQHTRLLLYFSFLVFSASLSRVSYAESFVMGVEEINYYPYFDFTSDKAGFAKALFDLAVRLCRPCLHQGC